MYLCGRMGDKVDIREVLKHREDWQIIDVRSPGEYAAGHIPGAINIPLFTDEQRARVGTLYTQVSPESAFREGLDIAGSRMGWMIDSLKRSADPSRRKQLVHCWRGGKRSQAVQWLFNFSGAETIRLEGGYKQYRSFLQQFFTSNPFTLKKLGGCTGAGKTEILQALAVQGEQVIDLEYLAHHKGSAFGAIGEQDQPTTEQFENNLLEAFLGLDPDRPVWLENESKSIGKTHIPDGLWEAMREAVLYSIEVDIDIRLDRALKYYTEPVDLDKLRQSFEKIYKRLGGEAYQRALDALDQQDLRTAASIALTYYDKAYRFQISQWPHDRLVELGVCNDVEQTAQRLMACT